MTDESLLKRVYHFVLRTRTMTLVNILIGIGLSIFVLGLFFLKYEGDAVQGTIFALFSFFVGMSGVIIIIKREINYTIVSFYGFPGVLIGVVISLASFTFSILMIIGVLRSLGR